MRAAVLGTTFATLMEEGDGFTIAQIAARAGVHETSIYRRWGTREGLIVDAIMSRIGEEIPVPDTGSLRGDLLALLRSSIALLSSPLGAYFLRAAAAAPHLATTETRRAYWPRRFAQLGALLERAAARGEIAMPRDPLLVLELAIAPLYFRSLVSHAPFDADLAERLADLVLGCLTAGGRAAEG